MHTRTAIFTVCGLLALGGMLGAQPIQQPTPPYQPNFSRGPHTYTGALNTLVYIQSPGPELYHYYELQKPGRPALRIDPSPVLGTIKQLQPGTRIRAYGRFRTATTSTGTIRYMYVTGVDLLR